MRSTRTPIAHRHGRRRPLLAAGLVTALALTATACNGSDEDKAGAGASRTADAGSGDGKVKVPADIAGKLKQGCC
ncbi:hypothetical protein [Streptomyces sp. NPDC050121]|uniref:hypothetical protein n=1 Tax=Streptomyces sp. NPDC050121 TaxID=3365601 RepID=UPI00378AB485